MKLTKVIAIALVVLLSASVASAAIWSSTSVSFLTGTYENSLAETEYDASIITFEHASGWEYGDNFFFVDMKRMTDTYGNDFYGEWHPRFSLGKLTGNEFAFGMVKDIAIATEVNFWGGDFGNRAYLYGVGFDLNLPNFNWFAINFMIRDDRSIVDETSFQISPAWSMPFTLGTMNFEFNGFLDYSTAEGEGAEAQILAQPQLLMDVGGLMDKGGKYFAGIEYQYWNNMYGVEGLDDNAIQLMGKWVF